MPNYRPRRISSFPSPERHTLRNTVIVVLVFLLAIGGIIATYISNLTTTFNENRQTISQAIPTEDSDRPVKDPGDDSVNIVVLGSDTRGMGNDTADNKGEEGERSDTMMLVHIPANRQELYVMSIMRDLWVEVPDVGTTKINGAMNFGGIPLVIQTIENTIDTRVDHVIVIDFEGFKELTEALGGVDVENERSFSSGQINPSYFPEGRIRIEGTDALRFVRERKAFLEGDYQRVKNQQAFLVGVLSRFLNSETLSNPNTIYQVVNDFSPYLSVDENLDAATAAGLGMQMTNLRIQDIEMFTIPNLGSSTGPGGASIILPDEYEIDLLDQAFEEGTVGQWLHEYRLKTEETPDASPAEESG